MICPNCQTRNPASARFCNQCGQPLPRVCPRCATINHPEARFCNQCGSSLDAPLSAADHAHTTAILDSPTDNLDSPPSSALAEPTIPTRIAATPSIPNLESAEERRVVTILFADLTGSTALADDRDAEEIRNLLAGFFGAMAREIHRHGGVVEKYIGDAVMAVFGLPIAHEDDPVRAIRAALDMQAALRRFNDERRATDPLAIELIMRIGVNTGEVVAANGPADGHDFLITGDPVNVASRLQQSAAPGAILIGPRAYRAATGAVIFRALPPISLRGKSRPVRVWEALAMASPSEAPAPRPRGIQGLRAPLVGREAELSLLRSVYIRVTRERRPHLVTIIGAPGVGKTRLARECVEAARRGFADPSASGSVRLAAPPLILEGRCPQYGEAITYWPLAEILRAQCDFTALDTPEVARARLLTYLRAALHAAGRPEEPETIAAYLGDTIGIETAERRAALLPSDPQQVQEGQLRAWRILFEALASVQPVIVSVDDIHWADGALLDLLEYIAARATTVSLLLLCAARPNLLERRPGWGGGKRNYVTIGLEALTDADAELLVRTLLPSDNIPDTLRQGVIRKAEGNPFYVEEIVRMLVDRGILLRSSSPDLTWSVAPEWLGSPELDDPAIPDTVQGVLAARLDLLTPIERDVLQHAAVVGRYFWPGVLRELYPHLRDHLDDTLDALQEKDLIAESDRPEASVAPAGEPLYAFTHALTREVTYSAIPRARRAHEHEQLAEWLETLARGRETEFADLIAQHYRQYYYEANLARALSSARRRAVRDTVARYLALAGDGAAARHASGKAERYYTDALILLAEDALPTDTPRRVELLARRGDAYWSQIRGDDAWADYREGLRLWTDYNAAQPSASQPSATTILTEPPTTSTTEPTIPTNDAAPTNQTNVPTFSQSFSQDEWRTLGLRLYRLLVQLPTRYPSLFQQPPEHENLLAYLREGLRLADDLGQRDTLEGAALLTAKAFFWWSWGERRGQEELLDGLRSAREAVRIAESLDDPPGASEALDALGNMQAITADLRGALESQARRLHWARRLDDLNELVDIHAEVSMANMFVGEYTESERQGQQALELAEGADADPLRAHALRSLLICSSEWDHWDDTIRYGRRLETVTGHADNAHSEQQRWAIYAWATANARIGDREETERIVRRIALITERNPVQFIELAKARLALARGATREAQSIMLAALQARSGRVILPTLLAELSELGARTADRELYDRFGSQALELGWRSGARKALAQATRARGLIALADARWDDAQSDLENALTRYRELGVIWEEARTRYALAGFYRRRAATDDTTRAQDELTLALTLFERLHAVRDIARARAALAGSAVRLP